jgi:hypothetical protein
MKIEGFFVVVLAPAVLPAPLLLACRPDLRRSHLSAGGGEIGFVFPAAAKLDACVVGQKRPQRGVNHASGRFRPAALASNFSLVLITTWLFG